MRVSQRHLTPFSGAQPPKVLRGPAWTMCGTPDYMSPEMLLHKGHSYSVDWWAIGAFTYECLFAKVISREPLRTFSKTQGLRHP